MRWLWDVSWKPTEWHEVDFRTYFRKFAATQAVQVREKKFSSPFPYSFLSFFIYAHRRGIHTSYQVTYTFTCNLAITAHLAQWIGVDSKQIWSNGDPATVTLLAANLLVWEILDLNFETSRFVQSLFSIRNTQAITHHFHVLKAVNSLKSCFLLRNFSPNYQPEFGGWHHVWPRWPTSKGKRPSPRNCPWFVILVWHLSDSFKELSDANYMGFFFCLPLFGEDSHFETTNHMNLNDLFLPNVPGFFNFGWSCDFFLPDV